MKFGKKVLLGILFSALSVANAFATERVFTYTYEPETMPQGTWEFENLVTARIGRNDAVGKHNYNRWDFRQELEYGVTDNYLLALYLNERTENYDAPSTGAETNKAEFRGVSVENKFLVWDPAEHRVGLSLYIEPTFDPNETKLEEKIILGQRAGDWKWALNLTHETVWPDDGSDETEGEIEVAFGLTRQVNNRWSLGLEFRNHNDIEDYEEWKHSAFFLGPAVNYRRENWWVTVTALAQVYGRNYGSDTDGERHLVLDDHERVNIRCIVGIDF